MISAKDYQRYASDLAAFRDDLIVDVDGTPRRFGDVQDDWQRADFSSIDPALMRCNGRSATTDAVSRVYLERGRGHSKTTDIAAVACWALAFATRPIRGYAFAADKDQSGLLRDAMETIIRLNPWLSSILEVQAHSVVNVAKGHPANGATLSIEASDVGSSYGILPDIIVADELCHWQGDGSLWHSLISSAAKRSNCLMLVISNAGFVDSWQWSVREVARTDPAWIFRRVDGPQASWLSTARIEEQRRMLPSTAFNRLILNIWSTTASDALQQADIDAVFNHPELQPMTGDEKGWLFLSGVDLSLTRDNSAVVTLAVPDGRYGPIRLADHRLWKPVLGRKLDLREIESYILELDERFGLEAVACDPWQSELLLARLEADTNHRRRNAKRRFWQQPWCRSMPSTPANLREQATLTIETVTDHRLAFYDCPPLKRDMERVRCEEKSYGVRLVSPRDAATGHGDSFSAFAISLQVAHELSLKKRIKLKDAALGTLSTGASPLERELNRLDMLRAADAADSWLAEQREKNGSQQPFIDFMRQPRVGGFRRLPRRRF